jgi:hypothetical protein
MKTLSTYIFEKLKISKSNINQNISSIKELCKSLKEYYKNYEEFENIQKTQELEVMIYIDDETEKETRSIFKDLLNRNKSRYKRERNYDIYYISINKLVDSFDGDYNDTFDYITDLYDEFFKMYNY